MNIEQTSPLMLHDFEPPADTFLADVLEGLAEPQKTLPCKYFYDEVGSQLFDAICELDEYYPTRTELAIMEEHASEMATLIGPRSLLIEYGSGSSVKTRWLLDHLHEPAAYVPIDISKDHLLASAQKLAALYPHIEILPVCADFHQTFLIPSSKKKVGCKLVYFPGSTIGNFMPDEAAAFLRSVANNVGSGGALLIGVDLKKDRAILEAAYNDAKRVTARFNLNLLTRINRELGADFELAAFDHVATYNESLGRVESYLVSSCDQSVKLNGTSFTFTKGERIHTENSYKFDVPQFEAFARAAGFDVERVWIDENRLFSVQYLTKV